LSVPTSWGEDQKYVNEKTPKKKQKSVPEGQTELDSNTFERFAPEAHEKTFTPGKRRGRSDSVDDDVGSDSEPEVWVDQNEFDMAPTSPDEAGLTELPKSLPAPIKVALFR